MSNPKDGGPAFPIQYGPEDVPTQDGMSLRDWFAGQAMAGILRGSMSWAAMAECCYRAADMMLAERDKSHETSAEGQAQADAE